eukprot:augustus_masked-scaffold_1-processed-gene-12.1-mRNA-1 protein AED:1.00 eAED:1.00 QI:0/-1/0/0/-1/1/1/0/966
MKQVLMLRVYGVKMCAVGLKNLGNIEESFNQHQNLLIEVVRGYLRTARKWKTLFGQDEEFPYKCFLLAEESLPFLDSMSICANIWGKENALTDAFCEELFVSAACLTRYEIKWLNLENEEESTRDVQRATIRWVRKNSLEQLCSSQPYLLFTLISTLRELAMILYREKKFLREALTLLLFISNLYNSLRVRERLVCFEEKQKEKDDLILCAEIYVLLNEPEKAEGVILTFHEITEKDFVLMKNTEDHSSLQSTKCLKMYKFSSLKILLVEFHILLNKSKEHCEVFQALADQLNKVMDTLRQEFTQLNEAIPAVKLVRPCCLEYLQLCGFKEECLETGYFSLEKFLRKKLVEQTSAEPEEEGEAQNHSNETVESSVEQTLIEGKIQVLFLLERYEKNTSRKACDGIIWGMFLRPLRTELASSGSLSHKVDVLVVLWHKISDLLQTKEYMEARLYLEYIVDIFPGNYFSELTSLKIVCSVAKAYSNLAYIEGLHLSTAITDISEKPKRLAAALSHILEALTLLNMFLEKNSISEDCEPQLFFLKDNCTCLHFRLSLLELCAKRSIDIETSNSIENKLLFQNLDSLSSRPELLLKCITQIIDDLQSSEGLNIFDEILEYAIDHLMKASRAEIKAYIVPLILVQVRVKLLLSPFSGLIRVLERENSCPASFQVSVNGYLDSVFSDETGVDNNLLKLVGLGWSVSMLLEKLATTVLPFLNTKKTKSVPVEALRSLLEIGWNLGITLSKLSDVFDIDFGQVRLFLSSSFQDLPCSFNHVVLELLGSCCVFWKFMVKDPTFCVDDTDAEREGTVCRLEQHHILISTYLKLYAIEALSRLKKFDSGVLSLEQTGYFQLIQPRCQAIINSSWFEPCSHMNSVQVQEINDLNNLFLVVRIISTLQSVTYTDEDIEMHDLLSMVNRVVIPGSLSFDFWVPIAELIAASGATEAAKVKSIFLSPLEFTPKMFSTSLYR